MSSQIDTMTCTSLYVVPGIEWQVLLTLAQAPQPDKAIVDGNWQAECFVSPGAQAAFRELARCTQPHTLDLPATLNAADMAVIADEAQMRQARRALVAYARLRDLETLQLNVAREVRRIAANQQVDEVTLLVGELRTALATIDASHTQEDDTTHVRSATLGELADDYWTNVITSTDVVSTGLGKLDVLIGGGLQPGRLFVLTGGPGSGKTTLANQIAEQVAFSGRPVVYLTTEDPLPTMFAKTLSRLGTLEYGKVLQGQVDEQATNIMLDQINERKSACRLLYAENSGKALDDLFELAREHFASYKDEEMGGGPGLLVIDYLQKVSRVQLSQMRESGLDLRQMVSSLTERLRDMARELNCTILLISSQNRASGYIDSQLLMSPKESGDIEYTADVLMGLTVGDSQNPVSKSSVKIPPETVTCTLSLVKNRLGALKDVKLSFTAKYQQFREA